MVVEEDRGALPWRQSTVGAVEIERAPGDAWVLRCRKVGSRADDAGGWTPITPLSATYLNAVSCPTSTFCMAVGDGGLAFKSTNGGSSWSAVSGTPVTVSTYHPNLDGVSCLSSTSCVVVGDRGVIEVWNGTSWTQQASGKTGNYLGSVSCVSISGTATCYAAGGAGTVLWSNNAGFTTWNTPSWSGTPSSADLLGISCMASGCTVGGESGTIFTFTATTSLFTIKNSGTKQPFAGVSCAGPCWASGYPGTIQSNVTVATLSPSPLAFGTVHVNTASTLTETITNAGVAPLNMGTMTVGGTNAADFTIPAANDHCSNVQNIGLGGTCQFQVTFTPTVDGAESATVTILSNASTSPQSLSLTGTGAQTEWAFVEGPSGTPYVSTWLGDTEATGWTSLGGSVRGAPQGCWNNKLGQLDIYAAGTDSPTNKVYTQHWTSSGGWSTWTALSSGTTAGTAGQETVSVVCANDGTDHEELFVKSSADNTFYGAEYDPGTGTFVSGCGWTDFSSAAVLGAPGATINSSGKVDLYPVGTNSTIYAQTDDSLCSFGGGFSATSATTNANSVGMGVASSGYDIVWINTSGGPYYTTYSGITQQTSTALGGSLNAWPEGSFQGSEIHGYGVGATVNSNNVYRDTYNGSSWLGWAAATNSEIASGASIGWAMD